MYIYFGQQAWAHVRCIALLLTSRQLKLSRDILWTLNNASELGVITLVNKRGAFRRYMYPRIECIRELESAAISGAQPTV